jgi:hypothetical protein
MFKAFQGPSQLEIWLPWLMIGVTAVLFLAKNIGLVVRSRGRLLSQLRERATQEVSPGRRVLPPPLPFTPNLLNPAQSSR